MYTNVKHLSVVLLAVCSVAATALCFYGRPTGLSMSPGGAWAPVRTVTTVLSPLETPICDTVVAAQPFETFVFVDGTVTHSMRQAMSVTIRTGRMHGQNLCGADFDGPGKKTVVRISGDRLFLVCYETDTVRHDGPVVSETVTELARLDGVGVRNLYDMAR